jgi:hypothetical protein
VAVYPLLAVLWALVLIPPLLRRRVRHRAELAEFKRIRLCFVGSSPEISPDREETVAPVVRRTASQRRRRVLRVIGVAMVATLVVALVVRTRLAWGMHLLVYDILIAYVSLLARSRELKARYRPVVAPPVRPPHARPTHARPPRPMRLPSPSSGSRRSPLPSLLHASR